MSEAAAPDVRSMRADLRPERLLSILAAGAVLGILEVVIATSFAALVFSGPLASELPKAIGLNLLAGTVILVVLSLRSSFVGAIGSVQDVSAVALAVAAASVATQTSPDRTFASVVALIVVSSLATGAFFYLLGRFRLGDLIRFVPYPVVGGFLAGTGWLLLKGAAGVATGADLTLANLGDWVTPELLAKWAPAFGFAALLLLLLRKTGKALWIPALLVAALAAFYATMALTGTSTAELQAGGWVLGPFPSSTAWQPFAFTSIGTADWGAVVAEVPAIATVLLLAVLALLLNATGMELALRRDVDVNRELRAAGTANVLMGALGGMPGFHALAFTALADTMGAASRLTGVVAGAVVGIALLFGASVLSVFPRMVLAGLIMLLALSFLVEWVVDAWSRLRRMEYAVVLAILVAIGAAGFLVGIGVGIAITVILFLVDYSRTDVVKHDLSCAVYRSNVDRAPEHRELLREQGESVHILQLQGFLFFGTSHRLLERVRSRVGDPGAAPVRLLVIDFRRVTGIDSSAVLSFSKMRELGRRNGFVLVLTSVPDRVRALLERGGLEESDAVRYLADLDRGVEWSENRVLEETGASPDGAFVSPEAALGLPAGMHERLLPFLERLELSPGHGLITQGEASDDLYLLESGRLSTVLASEHGEPIRLRTMGPGAIVGEITLYLGTTRTASVVVDEPSVVLRLSRSTFERIEREAPEVAAALHRAFARLLAERVADTNRALRAVMD